MKRLGLLSGIQQISVQSLTEPQAFSSTSGNSFNLLCTSVTYLYNTVYNKKVTMLLI